MMRRIEWIGRPSIFADPRFQYRRMTGAIKDRDMPIIRAAASRRTYRIDGSTARRLGPQDPFGLSRHYEWGPHPGSYIQNVEEGDWRLIQASRSGNEFRDVTDGTSDGAPIQLPEPDIQVAKEEDFRDLNSMLKAFAREG